MVPDALTGGPRFAAFCERYIRHTKGRWAGRPMALESWQREFMWEALEVDPTTGLRIYQEVGLGLPRKNGKSVKASATGLYFLVADGEAEPEVYAAAAARNQAGIVLGQSRRMVLQSPPLLRHVAPRAHMLECPRNGGIMRALSADAALQHGLNPSANIIDELHAHKSGDLYTALTTGTGAREQPFTLWISTAGVVGSILHDLFQTMLTGPGELEDRGSLRIYRDRANGVLIWWYGAPDGADIHDPEVWRAANPASWLQDGRFLAQQYARLKARGALADWRMYHLNQWVEHDDPWMPPELWDGAVDPGMALRVDLPTFAVVRIDHDHRAAAVAVAQRSDDGRVALDVRTFASGGDDYLDVDPIVKHLHDLRRRFRAPVVASVRFSPNGREHTRPKPGPEVATHGAFFATTADQLRREGFVMPDVPSTPQRVTPAAEQLMELLTGGLLSHTGHPELAEQMRNVVAKRAPTGWTVAAAVATQQGQPRRIVAPVAAMLAVHRAMNAPRWTPGRVAGF